MHSGITLDAERNLIEVEGVLAKGSEEKQDAAEETPVEGGVPDIFMAVDF